MTNSTFFQTGIGGFVAIALMLPSAPILGDLLTFDIRISEREVIAPSDQLIRATHDDLVVLRFSSDESGELHLHGYDIKIELKPDAATEVRFEAAATGRFPFTSHGFGDEHGHSHGHGALMYLEVYPD